MNAFATLGLKWESAMSTTAPIMICTGLRKQDAEVIEHA